MGPAYRDGVTMLPLELASSTELVRVAPMFTPQVRGVIRRLEAAGFGIEVSEAGAFVARRQADRGLTLVVRVPRPAVLWVRFAGWPRRAATLAEVRAWCDTFGASP